LENVVTSVTPSATSADRRSFTSFYDKDDTSAFVVQAFVGILGS